MKKRLFNLFGGLILGSVLFSCSDSIENASVSFRLSDDFVRVLRNQTESDGNGVSGKYSLKIVIAGEHSCEQEFDFSVLPDKGQSLVYEIENLPVDKDIQVRAFLYSFAADGNGTESGSKGLMYMTEKPSIIKLSAGNNSLQLSLIRVKFIISAEGEGGQTYYSASGFSGPENIPWLPYDESLHFSLEDCSDASGFEWLLNGNAIGQEDKTLSCILSDLECVNLDSDAAGGANFLVCSFLSGEEKQSALFRFRTTTQTAVVYEDKISSPGKAMQLSSYNSDAEPSELFEVAGPVSGDNSPMESVIYTFDSLSNLWTVDSYDSNKNEVTISKRKMQNDGLYSASTAETYTFSSGKPVDMYYDTESTLLYILSNGIDGSSYMTLYAFSTLAKEMAAKTEQINYNFGHIAVHGGMIYFSGSDSDCTVRKTDINVWGDTISLGQTIPYETVKTIASAEVLGEEYINPSSVGQASVSITDIQIGDGKGNDLSSLYVLYREYTNYINAGNNVYSRGALVKIDLEQSYQTERLSGFTKESFNHIDSNDNVSGTFYSPQGAPQDKENMLFGPVKFAALVPKKLVILDDGIEYIKEGTFRNKDSLVEFDIATESLSRGSSVKASKPDYGTESSGFTVED